MTKDFDDFCTDQEAQERFEATLADHIGDDPTFDAADFLF